MDSLEATEICSSCNGTGRQESRPRVILSEPCVRCKGKGRVDWIDAVMRKKYFIRDLDLGDIQKTAFDNIQKLKLRMHEEASKVGMQIDVMIEMKPIGFEHHRLYPTIKGGIF